MKKRSLYLVGLSLISSFTLADTVLPEAVLYKDKYCGCCTEYVNYLKKEGVSVKAIDHPDMRTIKYQYGTYQGASCHTMIMGDYVIEGHVPIASIQKLFKETPNIKGIALPGMPASSPGMGPAVEGSLSIMTIEHSSEIKERFNQE